VAAQGAESAPPAAKALGPWGEAGLGRGGRGGSVSAGGAQKVGGGLRGVDFLGRPTDGGGRGMLALRMAPRVAPWTHLALGEESLLLARPSGLSHCARCSVRDFYDPLPARFRLHSRHDVASLFAMTGTGPTPVVVLSVGQCGNQVAGELWARVEAEVTAQGLPPLPPGAPGRSAEARRPLDEGELSSFVRHESGSGRPRARAVMVDTEPRVVEALAGSSPLLERAPRCVAHSGRGNNWAAGYRGPEGTRPRRNGSGPRWGSVAQPDNDEGTGRPRWQGALEIHAGQMHDNRERGVADRAIDAVRRELEACDGTPDVVLLHSLAGGTGSGLGSRLAEKVRDLSPRGFLLSAAIAPDPQGDTVLQPYNTALCLERIGKACDAVALFRNEELLTGEPGATSGAVDTNAYIASSLLGHLLPTRSWRGSQRAPPTMSRLQALCAWCAPSPRHRLVGLDTATIPLDTAPLGPPASTWTDVAQRMIDVQRRARRIARGRGGWTTAAMAITASGRVNEAQLDGDDTQR